MCSLGFHHGVAVQVINSHRATGQKLARAFWRYWAIYTTGLCVCLHFIERKNEKLPFPERCRYCLIFRMLHNGPFSPSSREGHLPTTNYNETMPEYSSACHRFNDRPRLRRTAALWIPISTKSYVRTEVCPRHTFFRPIVTIMATQQSTSCPHVTATSWKHPKWSPLILYVIIFYSKTAFLLFFFAFWPSSDRVGSEHWMRKCNTNNNRGMWRVKNQCLLPSWATF